MMDSPFFGSYWNQPSRPRYSPSAGGGPVQPVHRKSTTTTKTSSPKIVSIPVHFVGSEETRSASALKIQKVFRGFLVRRSVKRIALIRREVEEVERRISQSETVDLIRRDGKERLRVNETLMALLFRLDSVRGIDSGVRDCRKAVIKKVIALQERVDAITAGNQTVGTEEDKDESTVRAEVVDQTLEIKDSAAHQTLGIEGKASSVIDPASVLIDDNHASQIEQTVDNDAGKTLTLEVEAPDAKDAVDFVNNSNFSEKIVDESRVVHCLDVPKQDSGEVEAMPETKNDAFVEPPPEICEKMDITEVKVDAEVKADEEAFVVKQIVEDQNATLPVGECVEESMETSPTAFSSNPQCVTEVGDENTSERQEDGLKAREAVQTEGNFIGRAGAGGADDHKRHTELLERMMEDNEKLMSLMTRLFERNELQTRMLSSLTQRVEQLERAFICDRLRRKKKRQAVETVDGSESTPDQKKCGKR